MIITLSQEIILRNLYAFSAFGAHDNAEAVPELIGRRQDGALRTVVYHCLCRLVAELDPIVKLVEEPENPADSEILTLETGVTHAEPLGCSLRIFMENALLGRVMETLWHTRSAETGEIYRNIADKNIASLRMLAAGKATARITPAG